MKFFTKILLLLIITLPLNVFSQIPNGNLEMWIDENTPEDWLPNNVPTLWTTVTRTNTAQNGSFAAALNTVDFGGSPVFPFLQSNVFPVNQAYGSIRGYYQFQQASGTEVLYVIAWFLENPEWNRNRIEIHAESPLDWVYPGVIGPDAMPSRLRIRSHGFRDHILLTVTQSQRVLFRQKFRRLLANTSLDLSAAWTKLVDFTGEPLKIGISER